MPRKKSNNPLATKRIVIKRSRAKGQVVSQRDLEADSGQAPPTEPIQTRAEEAPQRVAPKVMPKPVAYVPTMDNAVANAMPSYTIPLTPSAPINFASDDYAPSALYWNEKVPPPAPPISPVISEDDLPPLSAPTGAKYSLGVNSGAPESKYSFGTKKIEEGYSYGSPSPAQAVSEATSRFINTLSDFFGGLINPTK